MHALMIAYCTDMSLNKCINAQVWGIMVQSEGWWWVQQWWKCKERPPAKMLWYLLIIPRFKRLFANGDNAKDLTWHVDGRNCNGMFRHSVDSSKWKKNNRLYSDFGKDARNIKLGLATDGMNPYDSLST